MTPKLDLKAPNEMTVLEFHQLPLTHLQAAKALNITRGRLAFIRKKQWIRPINTQEGTRFHGRYAEADVKRLLWEFRKAGGYTPWRRQKLKEDKEMAAAAAAALREQAQPALGPPAPVPTTERREDEPRLETVMQELRKIHAKIDAAEHARTLDHAATLERFEVVWGCAKVSAGCTHCYSEALAQRYRRGGPFNDAQMATLTPFLDEAELRRMLTYKPAAGKRCFVGDMTDVFGEWVPDELLDRLFAVFALRSDVTWQVLTKRPERMRAYFADENTAERIELQLWDMHTDDTTNAMPLSGVLPNVWLGTSVEDQKAAAERIPHLLQTPAAIRFISAEPLLGPIHFPRRTLGAGADCDECHMRDVGIDEDGCCQSCGTDAIWYGLDWVIVGGESGHAARPCDLGDVLRIVEQCEAARVPCFVKQLGSQPKLPNPCEPERLMRSGEGIRVTAASGGVNVVLKSRKGNDPAEWPSALRMRQFPEARA